MQLTINLPDELGRELKNIPNHDVFVAGLIKAALPHHKPLKKRPLGALKGRLTVHFREDFTMTDEEFLLS